MQRFLQALLLITIISAVFSFSQGPSGCNEGKVWITQRSDGCTRYECKNNQVQRNFIDPPCESEGSAGELFTYHELQESPMATHPKN